MDDQPTQRPRLIVRLWNWFEKGDGTRLVVIGVAYTVIAAIILAVGGMVAGLVPKPFASSGSTGREGTPTSTPTPTAIVTSVLPTPTPTKDHRVPPPTPTPTMTTAKSAVAHFLDTFPQAGGDTIQKGLARVNGNSFEHSLYWPAVGPGTQIAPCYDQHNTVDYGLNGHYRYFKATIGLQETSSSCNVEYEILIDGNRKFDQVVRPGATVNAGPISLSGGTRLRLRMTLVNGDGSGPVTAAWGNAELVSR